MGHEEAGRLKRKGFAKCCRYLVACGIHLCGVEGPIYSYFLCAELRTIGSFATGAWLVSATAGGAGHNIVWCNIRQTRQNVCPMLGVLFGYQRFI